MTFEAGRDDPNARPLRKLREERLLTLRDLARAAGIGASTLQRVEVGEIIPRPGVAQQVAAALGVAPQAVAEFGHVGRPSDDREAARCLERMGYPPLLARRAARRHEPPIPAGG